MVILLILLLTGLFTFMKTNNQTTSFTAPSFTQTLTEEEILEVKKYAELFGLDNDTHDIDIVKLLEMGRKMTAYVGNERIEELHAAIEQAKIETYFHVNEKASGKVHRVLELIHRSMLIAVPSYTNISIKLFGGDKDGEPSSSLYAAA